MIARSNSSCTFVKMSGSSPISRRTALQLALLSVAAISTCPHPAHALRPGKPSKGRLLSNLHEEKTLEELEEERARFAEERRVRLERQRELQAAAERKRAGLETDEGSSAEIEANLRANYYYPTARKRYLPRVKRALEDIAATESALRAQRWAEASALATGSLQDAVLPMRLYASSLAGQGLSLTAKFVQAMSAESDQYQGALTRLQKACKKRDMETALASVVSMRECIARYRSSGHLESADFGIGDVPTDARVGSGLGNNNPALYNRNFEKILSEGG